MKQIIKASERHYKDYGWLQTHWLFSFSDYQDPANTNHGSLRVFNDDVVQPRSGFPMHPHEEMEIVSIVLSGAMKHRDSMSNEMVINAGDVQRMTAGSGLLHSEMNDFDEPVAFFQIWIQPGTRGLRPSYDQKSIDPATLVNTLTLIASNRPAADTVLLNTDGSIYRASLDAGKQLVYEAETGRCQFLYVISGTIAVGDDELSSRDQLRMSGMETIEISAVGTSDLILIDIPAT